jgi:hypothetical protein
VTGSGASYHYSVVGDQTLYLDVISLVEMNFGSRVQYIGTGSGTHCPLINELPRSGHGEVDLIPS